MAAGAIRAISLAVALMTGSAAADPCAEGAVIDLPDQVVAERFGQSLQVDIWRLALDDATYATVGAQEEAVMQAVAELLGGVSPAVYDAQIMGLYLSFLWLDRAEPSTVDLRFVPAYVDLFLPVLERNGVTQGVAALEHFRGHISDWESGQIGVVLEQSGIDRLLHGGLSDAGHETAQMLAEGQEELAQVLARMSEDAEVAELMQTSREAISEWTMLRHLRDVLGTCLTQDIVTPEGTAEFRALPERQRDLIIMESIAGRWSGLGHEPTDVIAHYGHLSDDIQGAFERGEAWLFAEAFARMREVFPATMPEDWEARRALTLDQARVDHVNDDYETWLLAPLERIDDDPLVQPDVGQALYEAMVVAARKNGLWPRR